MTLDDSYREMCLEVENLRASLARKVRHCDEITEERDKALRERDEAQWHAEGLRSALTLIEADRDEARASGADAYRRGAETMREACAQWVDHWASGVLAEKMRALPIPEEK